MSIIELLEKLEIKEKATNYFDLQRAGDGDSVEEFKDRTDHNPLSIQLGMMIDFSDTNEKRLWVDLFLNLGEIEDIAKQIKESK